MGISFHTLEVAKPKISYKNLRRLLYTIIADFNRKPGSVVYIFCDDAKILSINNEFLQHDYFTDVITFDYSTRQRVGGEVYISLDTVFSNAQIFDQDFGTELLRVIIHGMLHLVGLNDKEPIEVEAMRERENYYINYFNSFQLE